jgi:hypothetical protein
MNRRTGLMALPPVRKANHNKFNKLRIGDDPVESIYISLRDAGRRPPVFGPLAVDEEM